MSRDKTERELNFLNAPVAQTANIRGRAIRGDLWGVELEQEGRNLIEAKIGPGWTAHNDGSLRYHHGDAVEWVFEGPASFDASVKRIDNLFQGLQKNKAKIVCSNRTSTHVHFNCSDKMNYQVINIIILYTILEDILTSYCGESRKGNLFCLNARDAGDQLRLFNRVFKVQNWLDFSEEYRYAGLNVSSLNKFGTVEFRCMRGLDNAETAKEWLGILNELCTFACYEMGNPASLIEKISYEGPMGLLTRIFSEKSVNVLTKDWEDYALRASMFEGVRLIQGLSYKVAEVWDKVKIVAPDWWDKVAKEEPEIIHLFQERFMINNMIFGDLH